MSNVKALPGHRAPVAEPVPEVIELLEDLLEEAKAGHIVGLALASQTHENKSFWSVSGYCGAFSVLGALTHAQNEIVLLGRAE